jgi:adenosylmethionine-8-amino-7-oxononanoate aminotransferase
MIEDHAHELAAVVVEPLVQGAAGMQMADGASFGLLARACEANDVLLICDEVATGFGRTGTLFASEQCGLTPDLMCLGKGITGGYLAMSATVASQRVFDAFIGDDLSEYTFHHGHSYGGNALAAAVALRHLELLADGSVLSNVAERSAQLGSLLNGLELRPEVRDVRLVGLMGAVELDCDDDRLKARRVASAMIRRGILSRSMGPVLTLVPPLTTTADEVCRVVDVLVDALDEVAAEDSQLG